MIHNKLTQGILKIFSFQLSGPHYHIFSEAESLLQGKSQKEETK